MSIDTGVGYTINTLPPDGTIVLGTGGVTAAPSAAGTHLLSTLQIPITLSAAQTWTIDGGDVGAALHLVYGVSGSAHPLGLDFSAGGGVDRRQRRN
jgi:hypothetical protein